MKRERRIYDWLPVIAWYDCYFYAFGSTGRSALFNSSGSVTRFFANGLNQLAAFIEHFTRAQGTVVFLAGILVLIHLLETQQDEPEIFGIKKRWIISGTAIFLVMAIGLFLFVDFVQDTSFSYEDTVPEIRPLHRVSDPRFPGFACNEERGLHRDRLETERCQPTVLCGICNQ